jgi:GNAT superfamily N-acetyltransferase
MIQAQDPQALVNLEEAMVEFGKAYAGLSGSELHKDEDCVWYTSGIGFDLYSGVIRARFSEAKVDGRIEQLRRALHGTKHHWFVTPLSRPADLAERLVAAGGIQIVELTGLATELEALAAPPMLPDSVTVRPVEDEQGVRDYARLYPLLFEVPMEEWGEGLVDAEVELFASASDPFRRYLAYEQGRPIASAMVTVSGGVAALQTLCTLQECRNRGIGAALATRALQEAREAGASRAVVWSSPGARRLYERMGFRYQCAGKVMLLPSG